MSGIATASVASAYMSKRAGDKAAKGLKGAEAEQARQFDIIQEQTEPYREVGEESVQQLRNMLLGGDYDFEQMPGYQFRVGEGEKGVSNYMRGLGMSRSGRGMKEMERFRQGTASDEIGNYMSRLMGLVGAGQGGVQTSAGAGLTTGSNISNLMARRGEVEAGKYGGYQQAVQGGLSNYFTNQMNKRMMSRIGGSSDFTGDVAGGF